MELEVGKTYLSEPAPLKGWVIVYRKNYNDAPMLMDYCPDEETKNKLVYDIENMVYPIAVPKNICVLTSIIDLSKHFEGEGL